MAGFPPPHAPRPPPPPPKKINTDFEIVTRESSLYLIDDENILKCLQEGSKTEAKPYVAMALLRALSCCWKYDILLQKRQSVEVGLEMLEATGALLCCFSRSSVR